MAGPKSPRTFTRTIQSGPNKGKKVEFRRSEGGKARPVRVLGTDGKPQKSRKNFDLGKFLKGFDEPLRVPGKKKKAPSSS